MGQLSLTGEVAARGPAAAFVLTDEQVASIGDGARRFAARVEVNGTTLRGTVTTMRGENLFGLSKAVRAAAGLTIGETVSFTIARDDAPREVEVPQDLGDALAGDPGASAAFATLAFTHRKEFARWVAEAKRPETRERRIAETLVMLREGRTRS